MSSLGTGTHGNSSLPAASSLGIDPPGGRVKEDV
jgi:hypothetical protein